MIVNHWGKWVDSEVPTTGVFSNNDFTSWFWDDVSADGIDPDAREYEAQFMADHPDCDSNPDAEYRLEEMWDLYEQSTAMMGFISNDSDGELVPDPTAEWSGIVTMNGSMPITQVVRSVWGIRCALGSPCIPGQGDADTPGEFLCYSVPPDLVEDEAIAVRIFKIGEG